MFYLISAMVTNSAETIVARISEKRHTNRYAVTMVNYLVAILLCLLFMEGKPFIQIEPGCGKVLMLALWNGLLYVAFLVLFQISVNRNGAPLSATFAKLGVLLPTLGAILFFGERPRMVQLVGIFMAVLAIVFFNLQGEALPSDEQDGRQSKIGLLLVMIVGGCADFNSKIFSTFELPELDATFLFYTFCVALVCSVGLWLVKNRTISGQDIYFGILIGIPNQITTLLLLRAILQLPAFVVFPGYSVGVILLVSLMDLALFRQPLSAKQYLSIIMITIALVCLNL